MEANETATSSDDKLRSRLTRAQQAQVERNRQRALILRQARLRKNPAACETGDPHSSARVLRIHGARVVDSGGGFFVDDPPQSRESAADAPANTAQSCGPLAPDCRPSCEECEKPVAGSFLLDNFDRAVCDPCRRLNTDKYSLIARTEAKQEYLLRDDDLDERPPPLPVICRRNPHRAHGSTMKLYLRLQIEERALLVWGSEEKLEEALEKREEKKEKIKKNKFNRRVKSLRMEMRSSLYRRDLSKHEHKYGDESHNSEDDTYSRKCLECGHVYSYEKM